MDLEELYQDLILDHHKHPRCKLKVISPDASAELYNPLCGDQVCLEIKTKDGIVEEIGFSGQGCSISQASASMMSEVCKGKPISEVRQMLSTFTSMMKGEEQDEDIEQLGDAVALKGVQKFAARIKCAMLGWEAIEQCLRKLEEEAS